MRENKTKSALIVIDMENGFIHEKSPHCIVNAKATLPMCEQAVKTARQKEIPIIFVKRIYRQDGSDVEITRYKTWKEGGCTMGPSSTGFSSAEAPNELKPQKGDYTLIKPRWSAFFGTELDLLLRRLKIETVILMGTTTPNCIRTTCYDANALDYNVVILEDCCSSQTEEIQTANIADMKRIGAVIMNSETFKEYSENTVYNIKSEIEEHIKNTDIAPEPISTKEGGTGWYDRW